MWKWRIHAVSCTKWQPLHFCTKFDFWNIVLEIFLFILRLIQHSSCDSKLDKQHNQNDSWKFPIQQYSLLNNQGGKCFIINYSFIMAARGNVVGSVYLMCLLVLRCRAAHIVSRRTISFSPIHQPTMQNSPLSSVLSILHYLYLFALLFRACNRMSSLVYCGITVLK